MKKIIWSLLILLGIVVAISGCARWSNGHNGNGEAIYQLEITVELAGEINFDDGIYYIVLDADENSTTGPEYDISLWEKRFYYIKLEDGFFDFTQVEEGSPELDLTDYSYSENELQVTIALSDLGDPSSVDINVITTDTESSITYDHLATYFTVYTENIGFQNPDPDSSGDSGDGGVDFDIVKVTAEITTLY